MTHQREGKKEPGGEKISGQWIDITVPGSLLTFLFKRYCNRRGSHQECKGRDGPGVWKSLKNLLKGKYCPRVHRVEEGRNPFLGEQGSSKLVLLGKVRHEGRAYSDNSQSFGSKDYCLYLPSTSHYLCDPRQSGVFLHFWDLGGQLSNISQRAAVKDTGEVIDSLQCAWHIVGTQMVFFFFFFKERSTESEIVMHAWIFHR